MSKMLPPGMYSAQITSFTIDGAECIGLVAELDFNGLERRLMANILYGSSTQNTSSCVRNAKTVHPEVEKLMKAQPTKPIHSHEPWKQSVKRQGRQIGKSK